MFTLLIIVFIIATKDCTSLKLRDFSVPPVVMLGDPVWFNCSYDLERDKLYSIKWHKNNVEFYRYLPADNPPGQKYELPGIHLELDHSFEGHIYMSRTDINSEGIYRCEVSTEAPFFRTVKGEREMKVYVNPKHPPEIKNVKHQYYNGETVNVTCVSSPSRPAVFLKWWINDQEVNVDYFYQVEPKESVDGLSISSSILKFTARPDHFKSGRMKLLCEAIISQAHTLRSEEILVSSNSSPLQKTIFSDFGRDDEATTSTSTGPRGKNAQYYRDYRAQKRAEQEKESLNRTSDPSTTADCSTINVAGARKDGPRINGGKSKYTVGDTVNINCTSSKSQPPAELHWYINDREAKLEQLLLHKPVTYIDGKVSTVLGLRFTVKHRHFQKNEMRLRCTATLSKVKTMASEPLEAEFSEQQMSDLHVDFNAGAVPSGSFHKHDSFTKISFSVLLTFISQYLI